MIATHILELVCAALGVVLIGAGLEIQFLRRQLRALDKLGRTLRGEKK